MRPEKEAYVGQLKDEVQESSFLIFTDYRGMTVSQTEDLRGRLHKADARMRIIKNRLFRHAAAAVIPQSGLDVIMTGPNAMVLGTGDVVTTAKILKDFVKENQLPEIRLATLDGAVLSADDVKQLADLPSREILLATALGTLAAPMSQLVGVLNQKLASLVYVLKAVQEKKENE